MTIKLLPDGSIDPSGIDYQQETGPYWVVFVNNAAVKPDWPLPYAYAAHEWQRIAAQTVENGGQDRVELVQCTPEELDWAPVSGAQ
ncbi:hypothetical protein [Nonomuraea sp. LPB2021202275-12-8]|uniref:hypothetical protein n=1 Tax=Nonomuraea sp. LPB2021202275-12-8 TaxID=3120159 RepID=UPI00300C4667